MSIVPILNMLGSVAAYPMGEWLGRKKVFIFKTSWTRQYSLWNTKYALVCQKWRVIHFIVHFRFSFSPHFSTSQVLGSSTSGDCEQQINYLLSHAFALLACGRGLSSFGLGLGVMMPFVLISEITTIKVP